MRSLPEYLLRSGATIAVKSPAQLAEVAEAAVRLDGIRQMVLTTGTAAGPDRAEKRLVYAELELAWAVARPALPLYQELQVDVAPRVLAGIDPTSDGAPLTWNVREWRFGAP